MTPPLISIIIPAHNEADYIGDCLDALLASEPGEWRAEVIVVANACTDQTVSLAHGFADQAAALGWGFRVIDTATPGKLNALNEGEAAASGTLFAYLDADVQVSPPLMGQIVAALAGDAPGYASGRPIVVPARSALTRAYARFWQRLPFVTDGVPGFGLFAVNAAGRERWGAFPDIIADDMLVRLSFAPDERHLVSASYSWPMVEGLRNLVRVRRRQDQGVRQIAAQFPELLKNDDTVKPGFGQIIVLGLRDPVGFVAYALVKLAVKTPYASGTGWVRGR
ncbi:glycosyltransferase family 2 protein [Roseovarius sp. 2305UL8-3]|uniref:glycosyltransferase family 2 protein n=1 Tax=Roseovarius conchicola TaxID=3121636 RepID=UPI0035298509